MLTFFSIVAVGFFLGMRHATDPDHVIAVTTIVSRQRNLFKAAMTGIFWGIGHTLTIFVVGTIIILFDVVIPARIGLSMEFSVGLMLIVLGVMNIVAFVRSARSISPQQLLACFISIPHHGDYVHSHAHGHAPELHSHNQTPLTWLDRLFGRIGLYQQLRPLVVGIVHGLAGSAAVALLILTTIRNPHWAMAYLLVFGWGRWRHDADHDEHRFDIQLFREKASAIFATPGAGVRLGQFGLRSLPCISDRHCQWAIHWPSAVDASLRSGQLNSFAYTSGDA